MSIDLVFLNRIADEIVILSDKTDEEYVNENYAQYLIDNYEVITKLLELYNFTIVELDRLFARALFNQIIIIGIILDAFTKQNNV